MLKRWVCLILCVLLCTASASAEMLLEAPRLSIRSRQLDDKTVALRHLALIVQNDVMYTHYAYRYNGDEFQARGCAPASVTNALIALFDVTSQSTANALLIETMWVMANYHNPRFTQVGVEYAGNLANTDPERTTLLCTLQDQLGVPWQSLGGVSNDRRVLDALRVPLAGGEGAVLVTGFGTQDHTRELARLLWKLHADGRDDVTVFLARVSAGTRYTAGPFHTDGGHYVTLMFNVGSWTEHGVFTLLDSYPRALLSRETGLVPYPFLGKARFMSTWVPMRLQPAAVQFTWTDEVLASLPDEPTEDEMIALAAAQLEMLNLFGNGILLVYVPDLGLEQAPAGLIMIHNK